MGIDYPAKFELVVREHIHHISEVSKRGYKFVQINIFEILIEMLESRGLFERACQREKQVGIEALHKTLSGPLSREKIAQFIANKYSISEQDFVLISGIGSSLAVSARARITQCVARCLWQYALGSFLSRRIQWPRFTSIWDHCFKKLLPSLQISP